MRRLLLLVTAFIVYGSLFPFHFSGAADPLGTVLRSWPVEWGRLADLRDGVENVLFYVPLGIAAAMAAGAGQRRWRALFAGMAVGIALSCAMELLQCYVPGRDPSLVDIVANAAGATLGAAIALAAGPQIERMLRRGGAQGFGVVLLLGCWAAWQFFPFLPEIRPYRLYRAFLALRDSFPPSVLSTGVGAALWLAVFLQVEAVAGKIVRPWMLAGAWFIARELTKGRPLSASEVAAAVVSLAIGPLIAQRWRPRVTLVLVLGAIVASGLDPFRFRAAAAPFHWAPFQATLEADHLPAAVTLLRKLFVYGSALWLLRSAGMRYAAAGAGLAALLFAIEWVQRYLPGRTPEITDPLLALALSAALWMTELRSRSGGGASGRR